MKPLPDSVFVGIEGDGSGLKGRDKNVEYEGVPAFYRTFKLQGHDISICKIEVKKREQARAARDTAKEETKELLIQYQNNTRGENMTNTTHVQNTVKQKNDGFIEVKSKSRRRKKNSSIRELRKKMTPIMPIIGLN